MNYAKIRSMDISNGPGIRVSLFTQGCDKHCPGCFNAETWPFNGGEPWTVETRTKVLSLCEPDYIAGLSVLGGEPLHPNNIRDVADLCSKFKSQYPNKNIWIWTGYVWDELISEYRKPENLFGYMYLTSILDNADYIVDGPFIEAEKDLTLKWRGSSNQRIWRKGGKKMSDNPKMWYCEG